MAKFSIFIILILTFAILLIGCNSDNDAKKDTYDNEYEFDAKIILNLESNYMLVEVIKGDLLQRIVEQSPSESAYLSFNIADLDDIDVSVGDVVTAIYGGIILQSDPPQVHVYSWSILEN